MQATTCFHDDIPNAVLHEASLVLHDPLAFHPTNGVFDADSARRDLTMVCFLRWGEFTMTGLFLRVDDRDPLECNALEPKIVIKTTAAGESLADQIREAVVRRLPRRGGAQEAKMTGLIEHQAVVDRVPLLLAAVVVLLVLGSGRAMERSLRASMPTRGESRTPSGRLAPRLTEKAAAFRAGSRS